MADFFGPTTLVRSLEDQALQRENQRRRRARQIAEWEKSDEPTPLGELVDLARRIGESARRSMGSWRERKEDTRSRFHGVGPGVLKRPPSGYIPGKPGIGEVATPEEMSLRTEWLLDPINERYRDRISAVTGEGIPGRPQPSASALGESTLNPWRIVGQDHPMVDKPGTGTLYDRWMHPENYRAKPKFPPEVIERLIEEWKVGSQ